MALRDFPSLKVLEKPTSNMLDKQSRNDSEKEECQAKSVKFCDMTYSKRLLKNLFLQRSSHESFLDFHLKTSNGIIKVHKCILSASSSYFEAYFRNKETDEMPLPRKDNENTLNLLHLDHNSVYLLVEFLYSGEVSIDESNVQDLLVSSDFLCIDTVYKECVQFILTNLNSENYFEIYRFSSCYPAHDFRSNMITFILKKFPELIETKQIFDLNPEEISEILADDRIIFSNNFGFIETPPKQEKLIYNFLKTYFKEKKLPIEKENKIVCDTLRFTVMDKADLQVIIDELSNNLTVLEFIKRAENNNNNINSEKLMDEKLFNPRSLKYLKYEISKSVANTSLIQLSGKSETFDDSTIKENADAKLFYIVGMKIFIRSWDNKRVIGGLEVEYSSGVKVQHGCIETEFEEFKLQPDERIIFSTIGAGWVLDSLKFKTSHGRELGKYGGDGGGINDVIPKINGSFLAYVRGRVDRTEGKETVRHFRLAWGYHDIKYEYQEIYSEECSSTGSCKNLKEETHDHHYHEFNFENDIDNDDYYTDNDLSDDDDHRIQHYSDNNLSDEYDHRIQH